MCAAKRVLSEIAIEANFKDEMSFDCSNWPRELRGMLRNAFMMDVPT